MYFFTTDRLIANEDDNTVEGVILPYDEEGKTNLGPVIIEPGAIDLPDGEIPLTLEHDGENPIGRSVSLEDDEEKGEVRAVFSFFDSAAAEQCLAAIKKGDLDGFSIELDHPVTRGGRMLAGRLDAVSIVKRPAFPSARLLASDTTMPDTGNLPHEGNKKMNRKAAATDGGAAAKSKRLTASKTEHGRRWLFDTLAGVQANPRMTAALSNVTVNNVLGIEQPQYVGELWDGKAYTRRIIPAFAHKDLTSFEVQGWRWKTRPEVGMWTGLGSPVPSGTVETEAVKVEADRIAGAHKIDRKFRDFSNPEFWDGYFSAMTESYARLSDGYALAAAKSAATPTPIGDVPSNTPPGLVAIIDGILEILRSTDTLATSAFISLELWRPVLLTHNDDTLAYLDASLGFEEGTLKSQGFQITPTAQMAAGECLVCAHDSMTVHELGGEAPIRVEALDIANGSVDEGVFGYVATNVHDADGLALVTVTP